MKKNINFPIIFRTLGSLLFIESFFLLTSLFVALLYNESDSKGLALSTLITIAVGSFLFFVNKKASQNFGKREGYIIVGVSWVIFSFFGALPFYISGAIPSYTNAFFETISGFTTTGASILNDIESLPHGLLFWRSLTQWIGGMGMIVLSLAVLPILGIGGMQLFVAEVPGIEPDKLHPRIKETAKRLWGIYILFTFAETILLLLGGMSLFDAINHSFTTMATGGYSTKQASIAYFQSPYIEYVITIFMLLAGTNFTLSYFALKLNFNKLYKNEEFHFYIGFIFFFTLLITFGLYITGVEENLEGAFRNSFFQVVSIITTTGFATDDYLLWAPLLTVLIFVLMFFGGSAGSTGGGVKIIRIVLLIKNSALEFKRLIHPNAIIPARYNNRAVSPEIITNVLAFIVFYILIFVFGTVVMSAMNLEIDTAMGAVIASLGNIGPGIGEVGPADNFANIPAFGKWFLSFLMLIGRLEIFTVLILFSPTFWRN